MDELKRIFKPSSKKIRIKIDAEQTKIFLKTCQPMDFDKVQNYAKKILKDKDLFILKLTRQDI